MFTSSKNLKGGRIMPVFLIILCIGSIYLGRLGFTERGIPWTKDKYITGRPAKIIGGICIAIGICLIVAFGALIMASS